MRFSKIYNQKNGSYQLELGSVKQGLIALASGKCGVGESNITANLAVALKEIGNKVGVIDADIHGFSIPQILGADN